MHETIFIGRKSTSVYVGACLSLLNRKAKRITLKGRGHLIVKTVNTALITSYTSNGEIRIGDVKISTSEVLNKKTKKKLEISNVNIDLCKT